ncbi:MAG: tyrosine--tRNA ligase [Candidatus ainarchaeum sp.]|nr:tyrosine--tRNA ligase [Candidatus ainarchaeum sp.]
MDLEKKVELVCRAPTEEVITREDVLEIFQNYSQPRHYIGFEISGKVHIGSGLMTALKIKDFMEAGVKPTVFLADYHAWINGKLGGNLEKIQEVALGYFKHAFISLGLEEGKVDYVLASKLYDDDYWKTVLDVGRNTSINRMLRTITIMGRKESEATNASAIFYPAMQAADIAKLGVQFAHAGMDQRKVHMLAREVFPKLGKKKFAAVHGHLLPGLQGPARMDATVSSSQHPVSSAKRGEEKEDAQIDMKMSKSKPSSAIFIHDSEAEIKSKISKAFCPEKIVQGNPLVEYAEYLCMRNKSLKIERPAKFGGDAEFATPAELKAAYSEGKLHPVDLKNAVANELTRILKPSRDYFERNRNYLEQVNSASVTR